MKSLTDPLVLAKQNDIVCRLSFSPDGLRIASPSDDGTLIIWNIDSKSVELEITNPKKKKNRISSVDWDPSGNILVFGGKDAILWFWDWKSNKEISSIEIDYDDINGVKFSSDGSLVALGTDKHELCIVSANEKRLLYHRAHADVVQNVAWKPGSRTVATACWDGKVRLWNANLGTLENIHSFHGSPVNAVAWHPKQSLLASGLKDGSVTLWNTKGSEPDCTLKEHDDGVTSVAFSRDGSLLASKGKDDKVLVWRNGVDTIWKPIFQINEPSSTFCSPSIAFHPLRSLLASTGSLGPNKSDHDRTVCLWEKQFEEDATLAKVQSTFQYDVFLSHNKKDKPRVRELAVKLKNAGLEVWFDEWIVEGGDIITLKVEAGLEQSRVLLLCISPNALTSDWVSLERSAAIHRDPANKDRRFIPLLLADCELPDMLRSYKHLDFRDDSPDAFTELVALCRK